MRKLLVLLIRRAIRDSGAKWFPSVKRLCGFWRARGLGEDERWQRRKTDEEEMFLLAALPDPAAVTVSVTSSVSSCHCSAAELGSAPLAAVPPPRSA